MPNIIRVGGGGGGGLDLTVVGGLERPAEPKNNTLWLKTETEIGNKFLSPVMPANESATKNQLAGNYYQTTPAFRYLYYVVVNVLAFSPLRLNALLVYYIHEAKSTLFLKNF